ncbi:sporulation protein YlmC with PRC-barrel domain [Haloarcula quadrata]|jgi:sporulation protein YlmC with PRC-barrel domain|uniref:Photosystem reaction center subunit H n=4 Tax=Haloarcula TaxID=2237 RepID=Q5V647_HALMA|nr:MULTISPECIES: PRC-barrel domain-containing protein [Haloarcula]AAV45005.1 possible photosystem reaction center subunit H [Haloarcula marismortui ATCC 43049]EMA10478.1 photosystem reaction center subunit H [Haloarcula californiae ATCC 33799]EMA10780.1 photosystem reaction center subunit H [Haloarcula sinaiiensis ATCC 33800]NHN65171.1 photosystem reaction center subunit H [Haloarcula sp. JP-Z28]NHX41105.1 photosystem reaction center subunit H [Haloarcula sp. R1-2]
MRTVLANQLSNVRVVSTDGREVGTLQNITINTTTGELQTIVINSDIQEIFGVERDSDGDIRLPASLIESMRDHLTIQPPAEQSVAGGDAVDS